ncbi:unnamed protein product, partial [Gadus morhua 'NCC']
LVCCLVTQEAVASLDSALSSNPSIERAGPELQSPRRLWSALLLLDWRIHAGDWTLSVWSTVGVWRLKPALKKSLSSNPSHLRVLDLSYNHPGDSGAALLSAGLEDPRWRLDTLSVEHGGVWRLKPALKKCKCLFDSSHHTLTIEMESPSTQQEVRSHPTGNEDDG